ncbi:SAM-dependent methyltransferase [Microtetraspora sp. AC03309]|uniref:SAM-dependent methyltransferase n=1 Tax=Microtetraspora sp. AC03309 TaxID=2779376 RepID=UPI001E56522A|nr:SAM-dependent methyltransferase [Microtetraspora sp. AC03309]MCC5577919.1 SAM-dependent methyltransferase [Microtetraspora sp. AC03309]
MSDPIAPAGVNPQIPNAARMYDYYLGGKDNFAADREMGDLVLGIFPQMREIALQSRDTIREIVEHLAAQGIRQFLDLGSGMPTRENVHEIATRVAPDARVVYVDHDEVVCAHGRALLAEPERVAMVHADVRDPKSVLDHPEVRAVIDFDQPVGVLMMFLLHLVPDEDRPHEFVEEYRAALAPGSYLAIAHAGSDAQPEMMARITKLYEQANSPFRPRSRDEVAAFFGDFELIAPWDLTIPEDLPMFMDEDLAKTGYCGLGRKR